MLAIIIYKNVDKYIFRNCLKVTTSNMLVIIFSQRLASSIFKNVDNHIVHESVSNYNLQTFYQIYILKRLTIIVFKLVNNHTFPKC